MRAVAAGRTMSLPPRLYASPRHTMTRFLAVFLAVAAEIEGKGSIEDRSAVLGRIADAVDAEALRDGPANEVFHNPAKSLATRMSGRRVVLCGSGSVTTALAEFSSVSLMSSGLNAAAAEMSEVIRSARALFAPDAASRDSVFHDPFFHDPQLDGALPTPPARAFVFATESTRGEARRRMDALADADLVVAADEDQTNVVISEMEQVFVLASRLDMAAAYVQLTGGAK